ncbi:MAG: class I SAM-dependent methyltransferase [Gemmatimonadetes bacterium]|nr:class I SAM-dependent methyltransferase [Gemmatimonadota bacterium]MYH53924.1 class I SAM-dependent methyltransferase [Gemmatimonadota bacterium]MYK65651.1 class I SAM-dependent methyltransferase [Gemmatimonadota bacterium]
MRRSGWWSSSGGIWADRLRYPDKVKSPGTSVGRLRASPKPGRQPADKLRGAAFGADCPACGGSLRPAQPWVRRCDACAFMMSTLHAGSGRGIEGLEAVRALNFEMTLDRMEELLSTPDPMLLEVGCARGWFLERAARRGLRIEGIEPSPGPDLDADAGLIIRAGYFPEALGERDSYDAIVFNDVFEHLPDPVAAIVEVERRLEPGGLAVLNLPSSDGAVFRIARCLHRFGLAGLYRRLWQKGMASPHITYFNQGNLRCFVERHTGLRQVCASRMAVLTREGLWDRIGSTWPGVAGLVIYPVAWLASFVLDWLPSDAILAIYRKDRHGSRG